MEFVKEREKLVLVADYPKNDRKLTVGYGHTGTDVYKGMKITKQKAEELFKKDFGNAIAITHLYITKPITDT